MKRFAVLLLMLFLASPRAFAADAPVRVRRPAAAGVYYPADAKKLNDLVRESLEAAARRRRFENQTVPKALIVPAESLFLSSAVTGEAYAPLMRAKPFVKRVVLIGATNPKKYFGTALSESEFWETPAGRLAIDVDFNKKLEKVSGVGFNEAPFLKDCVLELQLPYVRKVFGANVKIVPLLIGDANVEQLTDLLEFLWGGMDTVVVTATNLSDGLNFEQAQKKDARTALDIESPNPSALRAKDVSALLPLTALLTFAKDTAMEIRRAALSSSADFSGRRDSVTGMGAWWLYQTNLDDDEIKKNLEELLRAHQEKLMKLAAKSVRYGFNHGRALPVREKDYPPELRQSIPVFVNLYHNGMLRGSYGTYPSSKSLLQNVADNAYAAAFQDFRYIPLELGELKDVEISLSFILPKTALKYETLDEAAALLRPNVDGVYLKERANTGFFLPSVWEVYADPQDFLRQLKRKAGLAADYESSTLRLYRFEVLDINSGDFENPAAIWK